MELHGRAYRLGGDEFCVLATLDRASPQSILDGASAALSEEGEAFVVRSSRGAVLVPDEVTASAEALRLADHRMYAQKGTRPGSAERQSSNVLVRSLHEREPHFAFGVGQTVPQPCQRGQRYAAFEAAPRLHHAPSINNPGQVG